jgi:hypothetical protein
VVQRDLRSRYGLFLDFVARSGRLDMNAPAGAQVTRKNVEGYVVELKSRVSSVTVYGSIQKLRRFVQLIAPGTDLGWLIEIERQLHSERRPRPKWDRVVTTDVLVDAGRTLMAEAEIAKRPKLKAALFWFRGEQGLPRRGTPLKPEWQQLRRRLKDLSRRGKLSGLIRYCSLKGIAPSAVDEAVVDAYMAYRKETTALAVDIKARRAIARAWNASRGIDGWPQQQLIEPPLKAKEGPRWEDFPGQFKQISLLI